MARYEWTTAKGANVVIEVEKEEVKETAYADGLNIELGTKTVKRVTRFAVNGREMPNPKFDYTDERVECWIEGRKCQAIIPEEIRAQIWAEERAEDEARRVIEEKHEAVRREYERKMRRAMDTDYRPYR